MRIIKWEVGSCVFDKLTLIYEYYLHLGKDATSFTNRLLSKSIQIQGRRQGMIYIGTWRNIYHSQIQVVYVTFKEN